ncbi:hypothetical protein M2284_004625 [Rhodococcus sp. LBL1]|nr:hypothetical protein [Rhodococcus sp. LBL1]MDH6685825.1 hypothetical protein [Rhodococcus sp. LBL2]
MTEPEGDSQAISVAELLARNGQRVGSGAGGRRRRGVKGGISVAELTGEFPAVRNGRVAANGSDDEPQADAAVPDAAPKPAPVAAPKPAPVAAPQAAATTVVPPAAAPSRPAGNKTVGNSAVQDRSGTGVAVKPVAKPDVKAQPPKPAQPAKKPPVRPAAADEPTVIAPAVKADVPKSPEPVDTGWRSVTPSNSTTTTTVIEAVPPLPRGGEPEPRMLSGQSLAGDLLRQGGARPDAKPVDAKRADAEPADVEPVDADTDVDDAELDELDDLEPEPSGAKQWAVLLGQGAVALIAGALMFKGFEKLWDMLPMVALVLAVLVIVGLVAMVRILRRTDDITSLVIALVAGVFVTLGPLAFLLSTR